MKSNKPSWPDLKAIGKLKFSAQDKDWEDSDDEGLKMGDVVQL